MKLSKLIFALAAWLFSGTPLLAQTRAAPEFKAWNLPHNALFFKPVSQKQWALEAKESSEWLAFDQLLPEVVKTVDFDNLDEFNRRGDFEPITNATQEKTMREGALHLLQQVVKTSWRVPANLVVPGLRNFNGRRASYAVFHSAFQTKTVRGVYHWNSTGEIWLYLESSPSTPWPDPSEILAPELLTPFAPNRPAVSMARFQRRRAFLPQGDYQDVQILLIRAQLPQSLSFSDFAYPGPIKP